MSARLVVRFRRWVVGAIAVGALLFLAGSIWAGFDEVSAALQHFQWLYFLPVLMLTLVNYGLRFGKWHYLLGRLGVHMPLGDDLWNFAAGLAMVISPGKAGELLKPYVVRERTGTPMARTIPALITERLTDGIAMLILAGLSVTTYAGDKVHYLAIPLVLVAGGLGVLSSKTLSMAILGLAEKLPVVGRIAHKLEEMYLAMRTCVAPVPLLLTLLASLVAWFAECIGYWLVFKGLGVPASLDVSVFLYAFATVAGGAMPGGLGVADGALAGGAVALIPGLDQGNAVAAALLIRTATLWFGVGLGAIALFRVSAMLGGDLDLDHAKEEVEEEQAEAKQD
ncbi:MAG: flippase-like domain-containing protein [Alphaproteobacteria bacterium]|nr:flippase-like domain-containing protein [Alphaproteobacteria bacterium]